MPTEQWGVSNNVRPTLRAPPCAPHLARPILRAPRFEEAAFKVIAGTEQLIIDIKVAK
jgi:uncharacterized protein (DUF2141 family)